MREVINNGVLAVVLTAVSHMLLQSGHPIAAVVVTASAAGFLACAISGFLRHLR